MTRLEVESRLSLHAPSTNHARWNIKGDAGQITLFLPKIWDNADHCARDYPQTIQNRYPRWNDLVLEEFIGELIFFYLTERVCLERAHERIKIKGGKCEPCCVAPIADKMFDHIIEGWDV